VGDTDKIGTTFMLHNLIKWMKVKKSMLLPDKLDKGKKNTLFDVPTIWHEPSSHPEDRYFSLTIGKSSEEVIYSTQAFHLH